MVDGIKMSEMCDISIVIAVYNHEKYIRKAIDSVLMQKTKYTYEVLIGEDCSTDSSRDILKSMETELPSNFHFFYRKNNYGAKRNFEDLYMRMKGKYYIILEGDDYWTYEYKLQEECAFLEEHPEYLAVAHNTLVVGIDDQTIPFHYPECHKTEYNIQEFAKGKLPGQTTTILSRNYYRDKIVDFNLDVHGTQTGDRVRAFLLAANGKVYCIQKKWSAYRFVPYTGSSFSATHRNERGNMLSFVRYLFQYVQSHSLSENVKKTIERMYAWRLFRATFREPDTIMQDEHKKFFATCSFLMRDISFIFLRICTIPSDKIRFLIQKKEEEKEKNRIISLLGGDKNYNTMRPEK